MVYQYVTVKMPFEEGDKDTVWTERINAVAAEGWRLVSINVTVQKNFSQNYATFEREV